MHVLKDTGKGDRLGSEISVGVLHVIGVDGGWRWRGYGWRHMNKRWDLLSGSRSLGKGHEGLLLLRRNRLLRRNEGLLMLMH
jgi:hypothetical protein